MPNLSAASSVPYAELLTTVVQRFMRLVGPAAALAVARRIPELSVDEDGRVSDLDAENGLGALTTLIHHYRAVFGDAALPLAQTVDGQRSDEGLQSLTGVTPPMRTLLVDDHVLFREGLAGLLGPQPDMVVVGQAGSVSEALAMTRQLQPDLVLMDFGLPDGTGLDAARAILADRPQTKIVFLTVHDDDERLVAALRAGAMGYLFKSVRAAELLMRLRDVARGEAGISPATARRILEELSRTRPAQRAGPAAAGELTAREIEIVRELTRGASNREIAARFSISENTVKNHVRSVLAKLRLRSRHDVAEYALKHGLLPPALEASS